MKAYLFTENAYYIRGFIINNILFRFYQSWSSRQVELTVRLQINDYVIVYTSPLLPVDRMNSKNL